MNLVQFLRIFWARKWMVLLTALTCFVVATTVAAFLPKRYPATARLLLDTLRPDPITGLGPGGRDARAFITTQLQFIRDDRVAGGAVDRLGLANDPATIAAYQASGFREEDGGIRRWLVGQIKPRVDAGVVAGSAILEIRYEGPTPENARAVVGALRDAYVAETLRIKTDGAGRSSDWYRRQAEEQRTEMDAAERRRNAFMAENGIVLSAGPGSPDMEMVKLSSLQNALVAARSSVGSQAATASVQANLNPAADQLRVQLSAIEEEIARASEQLGTAHPTYRAAVARKRTVEQQLANAIRQQTTASGLVANASQSGIARLESEVRAQEAIVATRKPLLDQLRVLDQEVEQKRALYQGAMARSEQLALEANVSETSFVILGDPQAERTPSYPKIPLVAILSALLGLALGLLAALVTEFVARRVRGAEDLAYATGAPVMVTVGSASTSPLRQKLLRLLGRRSGPAVDSEPQAI
jgi:uncharacterized protein involved in exopolysaccharide biosynthesis